jgi:hypothetical protein
VPELGELACAHRAHPIVVKVGDVDLTRYVRMVHFTARRPAMTLPAAVKLSHQVGTYTDPEGRERRLMACNVEADCDQAAELSWVHTISEAELAPGGTLEALAGRVAPGDTITAYGCEAHAVDPDAGEE